MKFKEKSLRVFCDQYAVIEEAIHNLAETYCVLFFPGGHVDSWECDEGEISVDLERAACNRGCCGNEYASMSLSFESLTNPEEYKVRLQQAKEREVAKALKVKKAAEARVKGERTKLANAKAKAKKDREDLAKFRKRYPHGAND